MARHGASTSANGTYRSGQTSQTNATASEALQAGANVTVTLDTGDTVLLTAANNGTTLTGAYTVGLGDVSADLNVSGFVIGSARDLVGNTMPSTALPTGANSLTGGAGNDVFRFAAGDSGQTTATRDVVTDFTPGSDLIGHVADLRIGGTAAAATGTQASINLSTGVATFAGGSGATLADALADIATRINAGGTQQGEFALFRVGNAGNFHLMISDATNGVGAGDVVVERVGVTSVSSISLLDGMLGITG